MFRHVLIAIIFMASLATPAVSQSPAAATTPPPSGSPAPKKSSPKAKAKAVGKPVAMAADNGPCQIGVISAVGDTFVLEHIGLTVFGNEFTDAPVASCGLDDLVVARARAAAPGKSIRRVTYAAGAFDPYYHPPRDLFRDASNDLVNVVRQVAANAHCERYLVVVRTSGQVPGTNQRADGIGLLTNWASGTFKYAQMFSFVGIAVFDSETFAKHDDPIGFGARLADHLSHLGRNEFFEPLKDFEPPTTPEAVAANSRLREGARGMLAARLDKELPAYLNDNGTPR
jgi:hypothetical protein